MEISHGDSTPGLDFSQLCTLRVGGPVPYFRRIAQTGQLLESLRQVTAEKQPLLMLGGGSNIVPSDTESHLVVIKDTRDRIQVVDTPAALQKLPGRVSRQVADSEGLGKDWVILRADAGVVWDELVEYSVTAGFSGIEMLSGIPGTAGAAPVQNIGAYGGEVGNVLVGVVVWDRKLRRLGYLSRQTLRLGYRDSVLKRSRQDCDFLGDATGRWVVVEVDLRLQRSKLSCPVAYSQLAGALGVDLGHEAPLADVRAAVLDLRRSKGMVLDAADHDTWSVGSFFVNPIVAGDSPVLEQLPPEAPRYPVVRPAGTAGFVGAGAAGIAGATGVVGAGGGITDPGSERVKLSAAWLISHSGVEKGFSLPGSAAAVSTKHVLSLTNRGGATAVQIHELASQVIAQVKKHFGLTLVPEPVML